MESKIAYYRQKANLTQKELAEKAGISIRSLQKYEIGERDVNQAYALLIYKISKVLGVDVGDLLNID